MRTFLDVEGIKKAFKFRTPLMSSYLQIIASLPHVKDSNDPFIRRLLDSNILSLSLPAPRHNRPIATNSIDFGADPEFIIVEKETKKPVLFSSKLSQQMGGSFNVSEAMIGADYGLLELRTTPTCSALELMAEVESLIKKFIEYGFNPKLDILEEEAIVFDHKLARVKESIDNKEPISYGGSLQNKDVSAWSGDKIAFDEVDEETTISAYGPSFKPYRQDILSAGGHIHIGGVYVQMLNDQQLIEYVKKLDREVLPLCKAVETPAAKLRDEVYGGKGEFRKKPYGIEYRSPSNAIFWKKNQGVLLNVLKKIEEITFSFLEA